ncbi:unnamed protein product [Rotaria sordida]|uniref:Proteasome alpha-type subunits domain-containing protein n=1 Tax=Rotaria sordida TaxID=392033 RepID=A0A819TU32_9BILA|nr:unnamed protein product [Rotaria sordida]
MTGEYDTAITVFSPDGRLFQFEYAQEAAKKKVQLLLVTVRKICVLDDHVTMAFAGLTVNARIECRSHRLNVEDPVTIEYITRYIADLQQKYTQERGRRPFDGTPRLYSTDPSGTYHEWKENAIGQQANTLRHKPLITLSADEVEKYIAEIEKENEIEAEKKKQAKQIGSTTTTTSTLATQTSKKEQKK